MYKAVVIEYSPKAEDMAKKIEEKANEMSEEGLDLITMSVTGSAKAILVFKARIELRAAKLYMISVAAYPLGAKCSDAKGCLYTIKKISIIAKKQSVSVH